MKTIKLILFVLHLERPKTSKTANTLNLIKNKQG